MEHARAKVDDVNNYTTHRGSVSKILYTLRYFLNIYWNRVKIEFKIDYDKYSINTIMLGISRQTHGFGKVVYIILITRVIYIPLPPPPFSLSYTIYWNAHCYILFPPFLPNQNWRDFVLNIFIIILFAQRYFVRSRLFRIYVLSYIQ